MAELTDPDGALLQLLERGPLLQGNSHARARWAQLRALELEGLVSRTTESWVITNAGRRALVAFDGRTRLTVEPPGNGGPP